MIETVPSGAALTVNGDPIGTSPASAKAPLGRVQIAADWPDGRHAQQIVNLTAAGAMVKLAAPPGKSGKRGRGAAAEPPLPAPPAATPTTPPPATTPPLPPPPSSAATPTRAATTTPPPASTQDSTLPPVPTDEGPPPARQGRVAPSGTTTSVASAPAPASSSSASRYSQPFHYPGRFQVGLHPLGAQIAFGGLSPGGYKLAADLAGHLTDVGKLGLWLGGGFDYTFGTYTFSFASHDVQLWAFVMLTFEKLLKLPLVPFARAGLAGDILLYSPASRSETGGGFGVRFGAGAHFYVLPQLGLGVETNFTIGGASYPVLPGCVHLSPTGTLGGCAGFYGNWDFMFGARFAF